MKKTLFTIVSLVVVFFICALVVEVGLRWVAYQKTSPHGYAIKDLRRSLRESRKAAELPPSAEFDRYVRSEKEIQDLFPAFKADAIAFGNSPFNELVQPETESIVRDKDGVLVNVPNHTYKVAFGRFRIGERWDPILFKDNHPEKANSEATESFVKTRLFNTTSASHDADGHRVTLPASNAPDIVLVMGDSVAYGAAVNDADTLPSQLQALHPGFRFVNAGVGGSGTADNLQRLDIELKRYGPQIKSVIYVFCENDWNADSTPEEPVIGLHERLEKAGIKDRVFIFTQYVERAMPDIVREAKDSQVLHFMDLKKRTLDLLKERQFKVVDSSLLVDDFRQTEASVFAGMALYVDHCHFSPQGLKLLAKHTPVAPPASQPR